MINTCMTVRKGEANSHQVRNSEDKEIGEGIEKGKGNRNERERKSFKKEGRGCYHYYYYYYCDSHNHHYYYYFIAFIIIITTTTITMSGIRTAAYGNQLSWSAFRLQIAITASVCFHTHLSCLIECLRLKNWTNRDYGA